jgi:hypothetical protein
MTSSFGDGTRCVLAGRHGAGGPGDPLHAGPVLAY